MKHAILLFPVLSIELYVSLVIYIIVHRVESSTLYI